MTADSANDAGPDRLGRATARRDAFVTALVDRLGPLPAPVAAAADQLLASVGRDGGRTPALNRFASAMGAAGWDLGTVSAVVADLAALLATDGPGGPDLGGFEAGTVTGRGWAHGYLPMVVSEACTDSLTGLATLGVLAWRLRQVYDQCHALHLAPADVYGLVVLDVVRTGGVLERDMARVAAATLLRRRFTTGETLAATGSRLLALTSRTAALDDQLAVLAAEARCHPALADATVLAWVETLPARAADIEDFLFDVV